MEITFKVRYPDGDSPYISLANPDEDLKYLQNPNEFVIHETKIKIRYDYPLKGKHVFEYENTQGFTRKELALLISSQYHEIYEKEEAEVGNPGYIPGMLNRKASHGPYGIWGHDLGDLVLHTVEKGKDGIYNLGIDS